MIFNTQTMQEILPLLQAALQHTDQVSFCVLNPDLVDGYAGKSVEIEGETYIYRGYKSWVDLAELLRCKILTPKKATSSLIEMTFKKLSLRNSFHKETKHEEKYGTNSHFFQIHKMEEPAFLYYYTEALNNVNIASRSDILNLGINRGDEFEVIKNSLDTHTYEKLNLVGIDHSKTAIDYAKGIYTQNNMTFHVADINDIDILGLGQFDLLISIGTLQSPNIHFKPFFMSIVQKYMKRDAAIILGFPNSRWIGGEMIYGAKAPNYVMNEMSLVLNDIMFVKKYLQQKNFRVTITGKQYLFLTATKIL